MQYYTQEEIEKATTITKQEIEQCFLQLTKLIIRGKGDEARDYSNALSRLIVSNFSSSKVDTTNPYKASTFFDWNCKEGERCCICHRKIPVRQTGHGIFMDTRTKPWKKWCELCATEEHKQHQYYKEYRG